MRRLSILLLLLCPCKFLAQPQPVPLAASQPPAAPPLSAPPQLSPQAAYDEAVRPLDIVRRAAQNWSDSELAALAVAEDLAKASCLARTPDQFTGEGLLAYARLCAFAQQWQQVKRAGTNYLVAQSAAKPEDKLTGFPNLSLAFDYVIQASLHLNDPVNAFGTAQTMLRTVPYDDLASDAINATVRYVQLIHTDQAIILLLQRQPLILAQLKAHAAPTTVQTQSAHPPLTIHDLYADAIALPAMQQFANDSKAAAASYALLEAALPATLSPDDAILTAALRRQYLLLGSPLPEIPASAWLLDPAFALPPDLNTKFGAGSIFLLFPDWCAQCVTFGQNFTPAATRLNKNGVYFYALLSQADLKPPVPKEAPKLPLKPSPSSAAKTGKPATAAKPETPHVDIQVSVKPIPAAILMGSPTLIVPPNIIDTFVATDFPLIIATDHDGIVRYIRPAPDNALVKDGLIDQIADRILEQWPAPRPQSNPENSHNYDNTR
jgi:hypothetical protein